MKKVVLFFAMAIGITAAQAQGVSVGVKAGANFANLTGEDADQLESKKMKIGLVGGVVVNIPVSETFSVNPEVSFSQEGTKQEEGDMSYKWMLNYINVPVMLQYNTVSGFYAETGPQVGLLMSAKTKLEFDGEEEEEDVKDSFKGTSFAWNVGAGYKHASGLGLFARYSIGLANIIDEEDVNIKTSVLSVGLAYWFGGNKK